MRANGTGPAGAAFLQRLSVPDDDSLDWTQFPGSLPFVRGLLLEFRSPVTVFVGENGSGKSTLLEAIAQHCSARRMT